MLQGQTHSFRMKIRGIHAEPFGGQIGGRTLQLKNKGFTIIRMHGNRLKRDVIETSVAAIKGNKHPAIYPVEVVEEFLHLLTPTGALVLDPFMGSGSTAVACKKL
ncbi:MAG: DNA methyltransferase, partial [Candidatus Poribacteria bacterium]|nr:DNA methyltransferase [Candidatus Poribacteria bacterium]